MATPGVRSLPRSVYYLIRSAQQVPFMALTNTPQKNKECDHKNIALGSLLTYITSHYCLHYSCCLTCKIDSTQFFCPFRFVGLEFIGEKVAEGALPVLQQHPRYGCVKQIATLHPELNAAESQVCCTHIVQQ